MKRLLFLSLFMLASPAYSVPVVPNFTQGPMTNHTETTSTVTETINSMDYSTGFTYSVSGAGVEVQNNGAVAPDLTTTTSNTNNGVTSTWTGLDLSSEQKPKLHSIDTRSSVSIYGTLRWTRASDAHNNTTRNHHPKCHRHNKYLQSIRKICLLLALTANATPVLAQTDVGGVSATANPVANSSSSVTNQAIQVLQGPYITNTYGDGIQCRRGHNEYHTVCDTNRIMAGSIRGYLPRSSL